MEKEDEESKNLKNKNLAGRKTRKEATIDQVTLDIFSDSNTRKFFYIS